MKTNLPELSEHSIQSKIWDYLRYRNITVWRINVGAAKYEKKNGSLSFVRFGVPGMSDLIGIFQGKFLAIEVKRPSCIKRVTPAQQAFLDQVNGAGGLAFVATSIEDVEEKLK